MACALFSKNYASLFINSLLLCFIVPSLPYSCIHHKVSRESVPLSSTLHRVARLKRHSFLPLNIHIHMDDIDPSMHVEVHHNIEVALKKVAEFLHKTIEVKQTSIPFLLERLNCAQKWQHGANKGKCSRLKSGPEFCSTKLTDYIIPDEYLSPVAVYNYTDDNPHYVLKEGIAGANFILFVISRTTFWCAEHDVQAYGSYCRLNNENRPVAGLLNMCPSKFSKKLFRASHYFNVIMHEVIHILGFSHHLYSKFKTCQTDLDCISPKRIIHSDVSGVHRLIFPELVKSMQVHFNCSESEFGAPLDPYKGDDITSNENKYTSHWHPLLMYTSIMTPSLSEDSYVVIDNITLALLYSTGWYKVKFEMAQNFIFGKGTGCNFGLDENCKNYNHPSFKINNASSCDILEYTIGKCGSVVPYHPCVDYNANKEEKYLDDNKNGYEFNIRLVEYKQHCSSVPDESQMAEPICLVTKCQHMKNVLVSGNSSEDTSLKEKKVERRITSLNCTKDLAFCPFMTCSCKYSSKLAVYVRIQPPTECSNFSEIKANIVGKFSQSINVPMNYITNVSLLELEYLDFSFCLPYNSSKDELDQVIEKTEDFLKSFHLKISEESKWELDTEKILIPGIKGSSNVHDGFLTLYIVLAVCGIFVITVFITFIQRFFSNKLPVRESAELKVIDKE